MVTKPRKPRIIHETVKDLHTSHWDLDMLSHAELSALLGAGNNSDPAASVGMNTTSAPKSAFSGEEPDTV